MDSERPEYDFYLQWDSPLSLQWLLILRAGEIEKHVRGSI